MLWFRSSYLSDEDDTCLVKWYKVQELKLFNYHSYGPYFAINFSLTSHCCQEEATKTLMANCKAVCYVLF